MIRIKVAFSESQYHDTIQKVLYFLYVILIFYIGLTFYGDLTVIRGEILYTSPDMFYCLLSPLPTWGVASFLILDIIISFTCCAVFIYPLKKLLKLTRCNAHQNYVELIRKYAILTTSAIVSTFVFVFFNTVLQMGFLVVMDNVINTLCILLMSSWYDPLYDKLCCCCSKTVASLDDAMSARSRSSTTKTGSHHAAVASYDVSSTSVNMSSTATAITATATTSPVMSPKDGINGGYNYKEPMKTVKEEIEIEYSQSEVP